MKVLQYILLSFVLALAAVCLRAQMLQVIVASGASSSGSLISFHASSDLGWNSGSTSTYTASYTVGSGSNRLLVCTSTGEDFGDEQHTATYNGVSMTLAVKFQRDTGIRWQYVFYLVNPASGANNVVITALASSVILLGCADYDGAKQSGQPDASDTVSVTATTGNITKALTTVANNSWVILATEGYNSNTAPLAGTGSTRRSFDATLGTWGLFDSNGPVTPAGSYSMSANYSGNTSSVGMDGIIVSFSPAP